MEKKEKVFAFALKIKTLFLFKKLDYQSAVIVEIIGIKVSNVAIFNVYHPPSNSLDKTWLSFITKFPNVIICGDFNAHHKMRDSGTPNQNGISMLAFIEENDY